MSDALTHLQAALADHYGLDLGVRPAMVPLAAALIFGAEVAVSRLWLARYRLGPAEWLWRSLTYGKPQPLRLRDSSEVDAVGQ